MQVEAERARIAVTKGIKATLARIRAGNPTLGLHLNASVKRGYVCVYRPDPRSPMQWDW
jgi:non-specific serine/threonine protein kinase